MDMSPFDHLDGVGDNSSIGASTSDSGVFDMSAFFRGPKEAGKGRGKRDKRSGLHGQGTRTLEIEWDTPVAIVATLG